MRWAFASASTRKIYLENRMLFWPSIERVSLFMGVFGTSIPDAKERPGQPAMWNSGLGNFKATSNETRITSPSCVTLDGGR